MTQEYYENLCKAGNLLCGFCECGNDGECERCMVNRLLVDACAELPDEDDEYDGDEDED